MERPDQVPKPPEAWLSIAAEHSASKNIAVLHVATSGQFVFILDSRIKTEGLTFTPWLVEENTNYEVTGFKISYPFYW